MIVGKLGPGDSFGECTVLRKQPIAYSVVTSSYVQLGVISQHDFNGRYLVNGLNRSFVVGAGGVEVVGISGTANVTVVMMVEMMVEVLVILLTMMLMISVMDGQWSPSSNIIHHHHCHHNW